MEGVTSTMLPAANLGTLRGEAAYAQMSLASRTMGTGADAKQIREHVGEFVGSVFYGTLMQQMDQAAIKGKYGHGGRGEEIFRGQLDMELAQRMGRAPDDPIANRLYESIMRHLGKGDELNATNAATESAAVATKEGRQA